MLFQKINSIIEITNIENCLKKLFPNMKIIDLLFHVPNKIIDRSPIVNLNNAKIGEYITVIVEVLSYQKIVRKKVFYSVLCKTQNIDFQILFFNFNISFIQKSLAINQYYAISGKLNNHFSMCHPDYITPLAKFNAESKLYSIYNLTRGVTQNSIKHIIKKALDCIPDFIEWIDSATIQKNNWQSWKESIIAIHNPKNIIEFNNAKMRLGYDELLAYQLNLNKFRENVEQNNNNVSIRGNHKLRNEVIKNLGFVLTNEQGNLIKKISDRQSEIKRMIALLQGDVGSGKTVIALFAILNVIECNMQAALLVPTTILASQHASWIKKIAPQINVQIITNNIKKSEQKEIVKNLKINKVNLLIGTHALFEEKIEFYDLALVVIDEQHRFGVSQRLKLINKNKNADILLISATPIPRTLMQILYGDIECFKLLQKPCGRLPIITSIISKDHINEIVERLKKIINENGKIYWICPTIEDSLSGIISVESRYKFLFQYFGNKVSMLSGNMKKNEIDKIMNDFKNGPISILVSTTVVEVGVDVDNANLIVIENAERFGLSQLHQLRGRVGRSNIQSYCILLYGILSKISYLRLKAIKESQDGFYIAEQDLKLRGYGDIIGKEQSGIQNFIFADLYKDSKMMQNISKIAKKVSAENNYDKYQNLIDIFSEKRGSNPEDFLPFS